MKNNQRKSQKDRMEAAAKRLEEIQKKIAPFTKPLEIVEYSTAGKWKVPSVVNIPSGVDREGFYAVLEKVARPAQGQLAKEK